MVLSVTLCAALAPVLAPADPYRQDLTQTLRPPSAEHPLGTDEDGRDQLSRLLFGARTSVTVGVAAVAIALAIGVVLGAAAGYFGEALDALVMRLVDVFLAFPVLVGAALVVLLVGRGLASVVLAIALLGWATIARLVRAGVMGVRRSYYVEAARSFGSGSLRVLLRHALPNCLGPVLVYAGLGLGGAIGAEVSLGFLGIGVTLDTPDWGSMLAAGQRFYGYKDYLWLFPAAAAAFTVLGFVLAAEGLRDALDPKSVTSRRLAGNRSPGLAGAPFISAWLVRPGRNARPAVPPERRRPRPPA